MLRCMKPIVAFVCLQLLLLFDLSYSAPASSPITVQQLRNMVTQLNNNVASLTNQVSALQTTLRLQMALINSEF